MGNYKENNGTTRVGDWLRGLGSVGKPILKVAAGLTGNNFLAKVAEGIKTSKELSEEQKNFGLECYRLDLQDLESARKYDAEKQKSKYASWLAKNTAYLIDLFVIFIWGVLTIYILARFFNIISDNNKVDFSGILGVYAGVTALATQIISFHRGSSQGSKDKSFHLQNISNKI